MADHTPYQQGIIKRYYDRRDDIMLARLSDLVSELYLAEDTGKLDRLWGRVAQALKTLGIPQTLATHILGTREPDLLARHLKTWLADSKRKGKRKGG
jgi:hypothetical protein